MSQEEVKEVKTEEIQEDQQKNTEEVQEPPPKPKSVPETPTKAQQKKDRYGFVIDPDDTAQVTKKEKELNRQDSEKESERTLKWQQMFQKNDWKKLPERVRKGIPDTFRGLAWKRIIDPELLNENKFARLPKVATLIPSLTEEQWKEEYSCWSTIEVDLDRTMPDCSMFSEESTRSSLRNVLRAYSCFDKELGYTQGMGFHAAMLLSYMDEDCAYYCFKALMGDEQRFGLRHFFLPGFPRLGELTKVWEVAFESRYKKIYHRFKRDNIDSMMYTPQWFLSAYMNQQFPPVLRMRIFERYIMFGSRSLVSFGLVIISRHKKEFLSDGMEVVIPLLQRPSSSNNMKDWRYVIKKWDELWIEQKDFKNFFKKAGVKPFF